MVVSASALSPLFSLPSLFESAVRPYIESFWIDKKQNWKNTLMNHDSSSTLLPLLILILLLCHINFSIGCILNIDKIKSLASTLEIYCKNWTFSNRYDMVYLSSKSQMNSPLDHWSRHLKIDSDVNDPSSLCIDWSYLLRSIDFFSSFVSLVCILTCKNMDREQQ